MHYVKLYQESCNEYNRQTFISFLSALEVGHSSKGLIASRIGKFLFWSGYFNQEDYDIVRKAFRQVHNTWSTKGLEGDKIPQLLQISGNYSRVAFTRCRDQLIIYLFSTIGMRVSQLCDLRLSDVWVDGDTLHLAIERKKDVMQSTEKKYDIKAIPLTHNIGKFALKVIYDKYMLLRKTKPGDHVFINRIGHTLTTDYIRGMCKKIGTLIGLDGLTPHSFRHFVATTVANTAGITKAAILLGHKNIATTQIYINPDLISTRDIIPEWSAK